MHYIGVDCRFMIDGGVRVRRVHLAGNWMPAETGRQWRDDDGLHVLIMLSGSDVRELLLRGEQLRWVMLPRRGAPAIA